jgi:trimeric autotransporter adhesin
MDPMIQHIKTATRLFVAFAVGCFSLLSQVQAVSPTPDGGYPGGNTAEGQNSLFSLTTGGYNAAVGYFSLFANTTGFFNTAVGAGALDLNNADSNTAIGAAALLLNTSGTLNVAVGTDAMVFNASGNNNTAVGAFALENTTVGSNTGVGFNALNADTSGDGNTAVGRGALANITTGTNNTALGNHAGNNLTTNDSNNIDIGNNVQGVAGESNTTRIGDTSITATYIRGINGTVVPPPATVVAINGNDLLGTIVSSKRFKQDIKPMDKASEALFSLKPVTFHYKKEIDPKGICQFGLVAEDVDKVNPDLIVRDKEGKPYSVCYDQVNAMLLNEFLKEHRTVQELKEEVAALTATVKEQAAQIQKVSGQLELSNPAPQTVLNNR